MNQPERWLVTGGCGFIGINLVRRLISEGRSVRVLDDLSAGRREDLEEAVADARPSPELVVGDVRDPLALESALAGVDRVIHLAAQTGVLPSIADPLADLDVNVVGVVRLLEAARRSSVVRVVLASSNAPVGEHPPPLHEGLAPRPLSPYGASKLASEAYGSAYAASFGLSTVALRFSNAYGPRSGRKGSVIALFCRRILAGQPLVIYGDGNQTRDFLHVDDLTHAVSLAARCESPGGLYHVGTGRETRLKDVVDQLVTMARRDLGREPELRHEPARAGEIVRNASDPARIRQDLEWIPEVDMAKGLEETWRWFLDRHRAHPSPA